MKDKELKSIKRGITVFFQVLDNRGGQTPDFSAMDQLLLSSVVIHEFEQGQLETMRLDSFSVVQAPSGMANCCSDLARHLIHSDNSSAVHSNLQTVAL